MPTPILLRRRKLGKGSCNGIAAVSTTGIRPVRHWRTRDWPVIDNDPDERDIIFRWGCTAEIPNRQYICINKSSAIHWCSNKRNSRLAMQEAGVPVPRTWDSWAHWQREHEQLPAIVRPEIHSQGRRLTVCNAVNEVEQIVNHYNIVAGLYYYISAIIPKVREYRIAIIQNRVAWVAQKTPADANAIAWNVAQGGRFDNVRWDNWPRESIVAALAAMKLSGADFGGVDVMEDAEGRPYVLEINSAPSQTSPYRQFCFAKCFDWIVRNGKEHFEDLDNPRRLRDFRHPALMETL